MQKNKGTGDFSSSYSPYLESDLLPSQLHRLDFEVNSYEGDEKHTCGHVQVPAFPVSFLCRSPLPVFA